MSRCKKCCIFALFGKKCFTFAFTFWKVSKTAHFSTFIFPVWKVLCFCTFSKSVLLLPLLFEKCQKLITFRPFLFWFFWASGGLCPRDPPGLRGLWPARQWSPGPSGPRFCHQADRITSVWQTKNGEFLKYRVASLGKRGLGGAGWERGPYVL